ncbi:MAG: glycosyltransferase family 39 protein [Candidatus Alcyoniella australis]|nr:glycosyltransferase family 39 protein [Candidatus Alcyoniella australis]
MIDKSLNLTARATILALSLIIVITIIIYSFAAVQHPLFGDEAIHSLGGRQILAGDWHLGQGTRVMKPFMVYYLLAFFQWIAGGSGLGGRCGAILAMCAGTLFLYGLGRKWFGRLPALIACAIYPLGPLVIEEQVLAKPEAFYMLFIIGAAYYASSLRPLLTGLFFSLAFCTKSQAAFFFPLVMILLYLSVTLPENSDRSRYRWYTILFRFSLGTVPPLIILVVWSAFTMIPFAWLGPELSQARYQAATALSFGYKFDYWISVSGMLLGSFLLQVLALIAVPCCFSFVLAGWAGHRYRLRDRPDLAALALFSGAVLWHILLHCMPHMPLYERYMVPHAPWLALVLAWFLVWSFNRGCSLLKLKPRLRTYASFACIAIIGLSQAWAVGWYLQDYTLPKKNNGVPEAVRYIEAHGQPDAIVFSAKSKPEFLYYTFQSTVDYECNKNDLHFLKRLIRRHRRRDMYWFLNYEERRNPLLSSRSDSEYANKWRRSFSLQQELLEPICTLELVWSDEKQHAYLYRILVNRNR